jgi:NitT/TauT family transport system ATP-binding protein
MRLEVLTQLDEERPASLEEVIRFNGVFKVFVPQKEKKGQVLLAAKDVNFSVRRGEFLTILGPSGCGKSSLLNLVAGLTRPDAGEVLFHGAEIRGVNTKIGYVMQEDCLLPWRTGIQNVMLPLEFRNIDPAECRRRASAIFALVGLQGFEDYYPGEVSGGMRKRLSIAQTLISAPDVILMDEPFGSLDAQTRLLLQEDLLRLWSSARKTIIFVTHDLVESIALSTRVLVMSARPGTIKAVYDVPIPYPRQVSQIHRDPLFPELHAKLWQDIRTEIALDSNG